MKNEKIVGVIAELYNTICDIMEGDKYMADQRIRALQPHIQDLIEQVAKGDE